MPEREKRNNASRVGLAHISGQGELMGNEKVAKDLPLIPEYLEIGHAGNQVI